MSRECRILIVEDDPAQRLLLVGYLARTGFKLLEAGKVSEAEAWMGQGIVDLVLLDLNLPDGDGLDLARKLHSCEVPVVIVSSRDADRVVGLEIGVDDFVSKPYNPRELVARVINLVRRCHRMPSHEVKPFGRFRLHGGQRILLDDQEHAIPLTRGEFDLLDQLLSVKGMVKTRDQLSQAISTEDGMASRRSVDVLVSRLRQKLEDNPKHPTLLQTVAGLGYRLND